jgi:hypothetical protein
MCEIIEKKIYTKDDTYDWLDEVKCECDDGFMKSFDKIIENHAQDGTYKRGKMMMFGWTFWSSLETELKRRDRDETVTKIFIEQMDRGVEDWGEFDRIIRTKYPNARYVYIQQSHGKDNFVDSEFDVIILQDSQSRIDPEYADYMVYKKEVHFQSIYDKNEVETNYVVEFNNKMLIFYRDTAFDIYKVPQIWNEEKNEDDNEVVEKKQKNHVKKNTKAEKTTKADKKTRMKKIIKNTKVDKNIKIEKNSGNKKTKTKTKTDTTPKK